MRHRLLLAALAAACATAACATPPRASASGASASGAAVADPAAAAAIRAALDTTAAGWNRGDLATYMSVYTDSVTSNGADRFLTGKAGVEDVMRRGFWRTGRPLQQLRYEQVTVNMLGADHALVTGKFVLTGADRPDRTGLFTSVWVRTASGWRMMHDHSG